MEEAQLFDRFDDPRLCPPEPADDPFQAGTSDARRSISSEYRVLLSGEGGDNLMDFQMWPYVADLRRRGEWRRIVTEVASYIGVRPFPWRGIRARVLRLVGKDPDQPAFPPWLASDFSRRAHLRARWEEQSALSRSWSAHPIHPR